MTTLVRLRIIIMTQDGPQESEFCCVYVQWVPRNEVTLFQFAISAPRLTRERVRANVDTADGHGAAVSVETERALK
jgi:hypothetical protein